MLDTTELSNVLKQIAILTIGVFACSTAVIFIKGSAVDIFWLSSLRLLIAAVVIAPLYFRDRARIQPQPGTRWLALPGAVLMALHMLSWLYGARITPAAPATLIVNLAPLTSPFFLYLMIGEKVERREIIGTLLAVVGVAVLFGGDLFAEDGALLGYTVCFGSMLLFCIYLVLARQLRERSTLWTYLTPLYLQSGLICAAVAIFITPPPNPVHWSLHEWFMVLGLAVAPTVAGHSALNHAMRQLRGQLVTTANTAQTIFAGVMAFFIFDEVPDLVFYIACALILGGILITILGKEESKKEKA